MDNQTTVIEFLKQQFPQASEEAVNKVANDLKTEFIFVLEDCKRYTITELNNLGIPSNVSKVLGENGFLKSQGMFFSIR